MAKKKSRLTSFFTTSPLMTAFGILVAISLLINLGVLLFVVLVKQTSYFDGSIHTYIADKMCNQDYADLLSNVPNNSHNTTQGKKYFTATVCFRDYGTGKPIDLDSVKPIN